MFNNLPVSVQKAIVFFVLSFTAAFGAMFFLFWIAPVLVVLGAGFWSLATGK